MRMLWYWYVQLKMTFKTVKLFQKISWIMEITINVNQSKSIQLFARSALSGEII